MIPLTLFVTDDARSSFANLEHSEIELTLKSQWFLDFHSMKSLLINSAFSTNRIEHVRV